MNAERYVVLGLARPRAAWFSEISRWATTAAVPVEFVKCLGPDEARARLSSGRGWSAFLVDATAPGVDRDLIEAALVAGAAPLVVADPRIHRDWRELGAVGSLPEQLDRDSLLMALAEHARPISRSAPLPEDTATPTAPPWRGRLVAVTGTGGTGASTIAAMASQGFGADVREQGLVLLADLSLHADHAVIHDVGDIIPGLPELVEAHRLGRPEPDEIRALTYSGGGARRYDLLLGQRRHRDWTALRPRAVSAALAGLQQAYRVVVADVDPDTEGERETGSLDIEERNLLARTAIGAADAVLVVGRPDVVGTHRLASLLRELLGFGVAVDSLVPVMNRAPRSPRARSELTQALGALTGPELDGLSSPLFIPERRRLDDVIRAADPWPVPLCRQLTAALGALLDRRHELAPSGTAPERVVPGSLGSFTDAESDAS